MFCRTKRGADRLVEQLQKEGVQAAAIHGDLRQSQREKALADFMGDRLSVLVATDVAARGLHIDGVDCVMHFDPPEDQKAYLHRSGTHRARRVDRRRRVAAAVEPDRRGRGHHAASRPQAPDRGGIFQ